MHMHSHFNSKGEIIPLPVEPRQPNDAARDTHDKQELLPQRLDSLQSKISTLPPEILSLIFQFSCVAYRAVGTNELLANIHLYRPLLPPFLGSISHVWRQLAWSTPRLWTTLYLSISANRARRSAVLLDLYLTNVHGLPITLHIQFDPEYTPSLEDDPVGQVFFKEENLGKIGVLELFQPPASWLCRFEGPLPFSQLVEIHIGPYGKAVLPTNAAFLTNAPFLKKMSFGYVPLPLKAPWLSVTTLTLEAISVTVAIRCLLECPNLVEFYHTCAREEDNGEKREEPLKTSDALTFWHLEIFHWSFTPGRASDLFLRRIRLPALRSLTWEQFADTFPPVIWTFFRNLSSAPLTTLWLSGITDISINLTKHIYHENPRIERLILEDSYGETLHVALASLIPRWNGKGQADERQYLTGLRVLEIRGYVSRKELPVYPVVEFSKAHVGDIIADLLIARTNADPDSSLCIDLIPYAGIGWGPETKEKLQEFNRAGAGIQLLQNGKQVDWLSRSKVSCTWGFGSSQV